MPPEEWDWGISYKLPIDWWKATEEDGELIPRIRDEEDAPHAFIHVEKTQEINKEEDNQGMKEYYQQVEEIQSTKNRSTREMVSAIRNDYGKTILTSIQEEVNQWDQDNQHNYEQNTGNNSDNRGTVHFKSPFGREELRIPKSRPDSGHVCRLCDKVPGP